MEDLYIIDGVFVCLSNINSVKAAGVGSPRNLPWGQFYLPTPKAFTLFNRLMNARTS